MRNYEIVFLVHPDQSDQTSSIISRLDNLVKESGGNVHRSENIGNRKLAYPIQDKFKASFIQTNPIEVSSKSNINSITRVIIAAKEVDIIDGYAENLNISKLNEKSRLFIAFYLSKIRVIDNFILY